MFRTSHTNKIIAGAVVAIAGLGIGGIAAATQSTRTADVEIFAPHSGDVAGIGGRGWIVDLAVTFSDSTLATSGSELQITGPAAHNDTAPLPGTFSPGRDDRFPSLVVLLSGTEIAAGQGQNLANLFNLTGVTDRHDDDIEIWDTWIVGAPLFGTGDSTLLVAVVDDLDGNGILDDAPNSVPDADMDGDVDIDDLRALRLASGIEKVDFEINAAP